ncbi:MAG: calcium-binding protein [Thermoguttaceae bacterium]
MPDVRSLFGRQVDAASEDRRGPLALASQDDRLRRIFGVSEDSPIPSVRQETLAAYYDHLAVEMTMPFDALYCQAGDARQLVHQVQVTELLDPRQNHHHNPHGLLCKARNHTDTLELPLTEFGVREDSPNSQLVDDYTYWFVNWR